ncbi:MAG: tripartite tricarboxylate transporter substrate binding protein [Burkholderiales bacterium]|nr:tripartite tricarboxylate transporter substrate binding protein [Burkholderiales bacterium]
MPVQRWFHAVLACALAAAAPAVLAQATRVVVPGPPGGFADIAVRLIAERLQRELGGPVVIEHKPGAGGTVALEFLRNARPDGATVAMINLSAAANETLVKGKAWTLLGDFEPIGQYAWLANVLIVNPSAPGADLAGLVEALRRLPAVSYASGGVGSPGHLIGELFRLRAGVAMTHVPYKGAPPAVTSVLAGETVLMFATASSALGQVRGGRVRALAVTVGERLPQLPEVPTLAEAGYPDLNVTDWAGMLAPRATPQEARERLNRAFTAAFADPAVAAKLREATIVPARKPLGPAEFTAFLRAEIEKWAKAARDAGIAAN